MAARSGEVPSAVAGHGGGVRSLERLQRDGGLRAEPCRPTSAVRRAALVAQRATKATGTSRTCVLRYSSRSSWLVSAQWRSSKHQDGGPLEPESLDEPTDGEEERRSVLGRLVQSESQEQRQVPADLRRLALGEELRQEAHQLGPSHLGWIGLQDAAGPFQLLGRRPIAGLLLVRERSACDRSAAVRLDSVEELLQQSRFPDPRRPE
mgnify:CR=1 FL=1